MNKRNEGETRPGTEKETGSRDTKRARKQAEQINENAQRKTFGPKRKRLIVSRKYKGETRNGTEKDTGSRDADVGCEEVETRNENA